MCIEDLIKSGKTLALAESCTGGAIAAKIVTVPGASDFLLGSVVAYSDLWKVEFLGVHPSTLKVHGAVSAEVVEEMIAGLFARTKCDIAAAVTGFAGPTGESVGTVYIGVAKRGSPPEVHCMHYKPPRINIIESTVEDTLKYVSAIR